MVMHQKDVIMEKKQEDATGSQVQMPVISIRNLIGYADKRRISFLLSDDKHRICNIAIVR